MEQTLAEFLKDWRRRAGFSQVKAAEVLGIPATTLQGIEVGRPFRYTHMLILAVEGMEARGYGKKEMA